MSWGKRTTKVVKRSRSLVQLDSAAMSVDDPPDEREAETGTGRLALASALATVEAIEHAREIFGIDADARVVHPQHDVGVVAGQLSRSRAGALQLDGDDPVRAVVRDPIEEEVREELAEAIGIAGYRQRHERCAQRHAALPGERDAPARWPRRRARRVER